MHAAAEKDCRLFNIRNALPRKPHRPDGEGGYEALDLPPFAHASVPEPNCFWLCGAAVLGLFAWRRSSEKKRIRVVN